MPGALRSIGSTLSFAGAGDVSHETRRRVMQPWRRWYNTKAWRQLRLEQFALDDFACRLCGVVDYNTSRLVCDHKVPHKGDERLFWDRGNHQTLCKPCHDGRKQREERAAGY